MSFKAYCNRCNKEIKNNSLLIPFKFDNDIEKAGTFGIRLSLEGDKIDGGDCIYEGNCHICIDCVYKYLKYLKRKDLFYV